MLKLFAALGVLALLFWGGSTLLYSNGEKVSPKEGYLYSVIACTKVYQLLDRNEEVADFLNHIHAYSEKENFKELHSGFMIQFIKLVERQWEREHDVAVQKCAGLHDLSKKENTPTQYNHVTQTVIDYLKEVELQKSQNPILKLQKTQENKPE